MARSRPGARVLPPLLAETPAVPVRHDRLQGDGLVTHEQAAEDPNEANLGPDQANIPTYVGLRLNEPFW